MSTKVSFIVPCRNKAKHVAKTVATVLTQSYSPMEIVLSDQGSTDDTFGIISQMANDYNGPNKVRVLQCPDTEIKGMAGLNNHLNWLHGQIEGDMVIMCSADDLNHPDRALHTVHAFEKHNPSYVGTCVQYLEKDYEENPPKEAIITGYHGADAPDEWVDPVENIHQLIGSSASSCWARDLYEKYGPMKGVESQDVLLPFFATMERGLFYVNKILHAYVKWADPDNTGLEGVLRSARDDNERHAITETTNYHFTSNFFAIMRRIQQMEINITQGVNDALLKRMLESANMWAISRDNLTMGKIEPRAMRI